MHVCVRNLKELAYNIFFLFFLSRALIRVEIRFFVVFRARVIRNLKITEFNFGCEAVSPEQNFLFLFTVDTVHVSIIRHRLIDVGLHRSSIFFIVPRYNMIDTSEICRSYALVVIKLFGSFNLVDDNVLLI